MSKQIVRIKSTGELGIVEGEYTTLNSQQGNQKLLNININLANVLPEYITEKIGSVRFKFTPDGQFTADGTG